jgi:hypothetical protein
LEKYHYSSPILKGAIIILPLLEKCHAIRLWELWAQLQCMGNSSIFVWTILPSATSLALLTDVWAPLVIPFLCSYLPWPTSFLPHLLPENVEVREATTVVSGWWRVMPTAGSGVPAARGGGMSDTTGSSSWWRNERHNRELAAAAHGGGMLPRGHSRDTHETTSITPRCYRFFSLLKHVMSIIFMWHCM